jgi:hypothetical protein
MPFNAGDCAHESVAKKIPIAAIRSIMKSPHLTTDNHAGISAFAQGSLRHNGTMANIRELDVNGTRRVRDVSADRPRDSRGGQER